MHPNKAIAFFMEKIFNPSVIFINNQINKIAGYDLPEDTNGVRLRRATANALEGIYHLLLCIPPASWMESHGWAPRSFQLEEAKSCLRFAIRRLKEIRL